MPTINEMRLLSDAMNDLAGTFQQNKAFRERRRQMDTDNALQERMLQMREKAQQEESGYRRDTTAETARHHKALEDYQADIKKAQQEQNADRRNERMFDIFQEMGKNGMLTDDALKAMEGEFQKRFGNAGVGVRLFKLPPQQGNVAPQFHTDPETGERFATYGKDMQHSGSTGETEVETFDPETGQRQIRRTRRLKPGAPGIVTEPPKPTDPVQAARIKALLRRIDTEAGEIEKGNESTGLFGMGEGREARIKRALAQIAELEGKTPPAPGAAPAPGITAPPSPTPVRPPGAAGAVPLFGGQDIAPRAVTAGAGAPAGDRVSVVSPDGKRGSIPRSQLQAALAKGYKLAEPARPAPAEDEALGER